MRVNNVVDNLDGTFDVEFETFNWFNTTSDGGVNRVLFFTDGVLETPNQTGDLFGEKRLMNTLNATGDASLHDIKQSVLEALREFAGGSLSHDDVTLMAIEIR